ncbi:MAG TPA: histidine kinase [Xanthomonadales bacterium]|nr:histidine kinase [Xanthomonadales bacterium]
MTRVRELLADKPDRIIQIGPQVPVLEAIRLMALEGIGALLVVEHGRLLGIVSERDYARKVILHGKASANTPVREIMSSPVVSVTPEASVAECMSLMTERRFRHLPVLDGETLVGVVSIGDLVKSVIDEQRREIDQLQRFISS